MPWLFCRLVSQLNRLFRFSLLPGVHVTFVVNLVQRRFVVVPRVVVVLKARQRRQDEPGQAAFREIGLMRFAGM